MKAAATGALLSMSSFNGFELISQFGQGFTEGFAVNANM